ncbi:DUF6370 family protein [Pedobacter sp. UC225_65]|uniref:DUF6370 family protein n=1 Tax=Pedobacter sp. UC225_65 TaxID=3350173 RepID=UPI00366C4DB7
MKQLTLLLFLALFGITASAQSPAKKTTAAPKVLKNQIVDISCGTCQFKMKGKDCELAVRIDGKSYFVDGKKIDDFGDAHDEHGFCNAISKAEVTGSIVKNRFKATAIKLLDDKAKM